MTSLINAISQIRLFLFMGIALTLSAGAVHAAGEGPTIIERWVAQSKDISIPGLALDVTYDNLSYQDANDTTTIDNLQIVVRISFPNNTANPLSFETVIPKIDIVGLTEDANYYSTQSIAIDTLDFGYQFNALNIMFKATYSGIKADDMRWAKLPEIVDDPAKPISKYYPIARAMADFSAASMVVDSITVEQRLPQENTIQRFTYGRIETGPIVKGNYASAIYHGLEMNIDRIDETRTIPDNISLSMGKIEIKDYNFGTWIRLFDPDQPLSTAETPYQTLLGSTILNDFIISETENLTFQIERIHLADIGVRAPSTPLLNRLDGLFLQAQVAQEPNPNEVLETILSFYGMMRLGLFEMNDMDINARREGEMQLGTFRIAGLSASGLEEFRLSNFKFKDRKNSINLGKFQLANVGFPNVTNFTQGWIPIALGGASKILDSAVPTVENIEVADLNIDAGRDGAFSADLFKLTMGGFIGRIPTQIAYQLDNFSMPADKLDREARVFLENLGYNQLRISDKASILWNEETQTITSNTHSIFWDAFETKSEIQIGNVARILFEDVDNIQTNALALTFDKANIIFEDYSIIKRALDFAANEQNISQDEITNQILPLIRLIFSDLFDDPELVVDITDAFATMLQGNDGTLTVNFVAEPPLPLQELIETTSRLPQGRKNILDRVDIEISAE